MQNKSLTEPLEFYDNPRTKNTDVMDACSSNNSTLNHPMQNLYQNPQYQYQQSWNQNPQYQYQYQQPSMPSVQNNYIHLHQKSIRTPKPKATQVSGMTAEDGSIWCQIYYNDGTAKSVRLIENDRFLIKIFEMKSEDLRLKNEYYLVAFFNDNMAHVKRCGFLVEKKDLANGRLLFMRMQSLGFHFNRSISDKTIRIALVSLFSCVAVDQQVFEYSLLPGWHLSTYQDCSTWEKKVFAADLKAPLFPVKDKFFCRESPTQEMLKRYLDFFAGFRDWKTRLMLLMYVFVGIFSSMFCEQHIPVPFYLNLLADDVRSESIAALFQVFNRHRLSIVDASLTRKQLEERLFPLKDEAFILDARPDSAASPYELKKQRSTIDALTSRVERGITLSDGRKWQNALVVVSSAYRHGNALNCELCQTDLSALDRDTVTAITHVMGGVVGYAEGHSEDVRMIFAKNREGTEERTLPLRIVFDILEQYFEANGYSLLTVLGLSDTPDFDSLFSEEYDLSADSVDALIALIRDMTLGGKKCRSGPRASYLEDTIYYDDQFIDIPTDMLTQYLKQQHRVEDGKRALRALRERGDLETDSPKTMVKKIQHGGVRCDYYRIRSSLFDRPGVVPFLARMEGM